MSGALFAVEFVLKSSRLGLDRLSTSTVFVSTSVAAGVVGFLRAQGQALGIAGAGTHLVGRIPYFSIQPNLLIDVMQFSALGLGECAKGISKPARNPGGATGQYMIVTAISEGCHRLVDGVRH